MEFKSVQHIIKHKCINLSLLLTGAVFVFISLYSFNATAKDSSMLNLSEDNVMVEQAEKKIANQTMSEADLDRLISALAFIKTNYIYAIDDSTLVDKIIQGTLSELDPHSSYLVPDNMQSTLNNVKGKFAGIGVEFTIKNGSAEVISAVDDTPADRAGIKSGDIIIKVEDTLVGGETAAKVHELLVGEEGQSVNLVIFRPSTNETLALTLVREKISKKLVLSQLLANDILYIKLPYFNKNSGKEIIETILTAQTTLLQQADFDLSKQGNLLQGLIIDLRNNPGGEVYGCVEAVNAFLDAEKLENKLIVYALGRNDEEYFRMEASGEDILSGAPIVILLNQGSASAAEIFSGAMQDHSRAIILGQPSFGKGSVQSVLQMGDGYGLKLTSALYYTPHGRVIQARGIQPDILVAPMEIPEKEKIDIVNFLGEKYLNKHIVNPQAQDMQHKPYKSFSVNEAFQLNESFNEKQVALIEELARDHQVRQAITTIQAQRVRL